MKGNTGALAQVGLPRRSLHRHSQLPVSLLVTAPMCASALGFSPASPTQPPAPGGGA